MSKFTTKLPVILMAFIMLLSSSGIIQVTHICKMSLEKQNKFSIVDQNSVSHDCCGIPIKKSTADSGCCNTVVKFYVNKTVTTLKEKIIFQVYSNFENISFFNFKEEYIQRVDYEIRDLKFPPDAVGKQIIISISSFLI